ncbi:hypothetical protein D9M68_236800 [compost metagenome]
MTVRKPLFTLPRTANAMIGPPMESKTARLTVLIDPVKKKAFEELCAAQDLTPSQVVRQLIRDYLAQHGVGYATQSKPGGKA